jgi:hypothetical protein
MTMKKFRRFAAMAVILTGALVFAGCVQPSTDVGGGGGGYLTTDPVTGEQLVTVRIPTSASATRALTLDQARGGIDFYEVIFKHPDGRVFSASATKDKVLALQLPVATYTTVLLGGIKSTGVLLASDYITGYEILPTTTTIEYTLKALTVGADADVAFTVPDIPVGDPSGYENGYPYFSLPSGSWGFGSTTISAFPNAAIFDEIHTTVFTDGVEAFEKVSKLQNFVAEYEAGLIRAKGLSDYAESLKTYNGTAGAEAYADAATNAAAAYGDLTGLITLINGLVIIGDDIAAINTATGKSISLTVPDTTTTLDGRLSGVQTAYTNAATTARSDPVSTNNSNISTATSGKSTLESDTTFSGFTSASIQTQILEAGKEFAFLSPVKLGSLNADLQDSTEKETLALPFAFGYIDEMTSEINFILLTPPKFGFTKLYYDFNFKAFGDDKLNTWHVKEGLDNFVIDSGANNGGGILLKIGGAQSGYIIIDNTTSYGN